MLVSCSVTQRIALVVFSFGLSTLAAPMAMAAVLTFNLDGDFGVSGPFGGTGLEGGSFTGSFSYDTLEPDQSPGEPLIGIYALTSWNIDLFFSGGGGLAGNMNSSDGGDGDLFVVPDSTLDYPGNIGLEINDNGGLPTDVALGLYFDLSIASIMPPTDFVGSSFSDGIFAILGGGIEAPATFIDDASISEVPIPAAAWLFGPALLGLAAAKRRKA